MKVGSVITIFAQDTNPPKVKMFIVVAQSSTHLATVYINTNTRLQDLVFGIQGSQLPLSPMTCPFLDHDSFADCSDVREKTKEKINNLLQREPGRLVGQIPPNILGQIIQLITRARTVSPDIKTKYGFTF